MINLLTIINITSIYVPDEESQYDRSQEEDFLYGDLINIFSKATENSDGILIILNGNINSSGIGLIVKFLDEAYEKKIDIFFCLPQALRDLFDMLGISDMVNLYRSPKECLEDISFKTQKTIEAKIRFLP